MPLRPQRRRILVLVPGELGERLSGPEIRAWQFACALTADHDVTAVIKARAGGQRDGVRLVPWSRRRLVYEALRHDIVISHCLPPFLLALKSLCRLVAVSDQYDPLELELATLGAGRFKASELWAARAVRELQLRYADVVLCAAAPQRDALRSASESLRVEGAADPIVVPFGIPADPGPGTARPLREHFPQIAQGDIVVLWWGSVWRWLDAETAIRAFERMAAARPDVKLVITAGRSAKPDVERMAATEQARDLARSLGLLGQTVLFLDDWIPYEARHDYLGEADIGLTLHHETPEAELAARARYMDYLWAGLPCVLGRGDELAEQFGAAGFARLLKPGDPASVAEALLELAGSPDRLADAQAAGRRLADGLRWDVVSEPLLTALEKTHRNRTLSVRDSAALLAGTGRYYARQVADRAVAAVAPDPAS